MVEEVSLGRYCINCVTHVLNDKKMLAGEQLVINDYVRSSVKQQYRLAFCGWKGTHSPIYLKYCAQIKKCTEIKYLVGCKESEKTSR